MHNSTPPKAEKEALDLLRSVNDLVTQEARPPGIRIGSAHHTLHLAFEDIELIARATIAWHRTHSDGICPDCPENQPWYCYRV